MTVRHAKDSPHEECFFLDSEADYKDPKNLAVVIAHEHAEAFKKAGIADPSKHYDGKSIRVTGKVIREKDADPHPGDRPEADRGRRREEEGRLMDDGPIARGPTRRWRTPTTSGPGPSRTTPTTTGRRCWRCCRRLAACACSMRGAGLGSTRTC